LASITPKRRGGETAVQLYRSYGGIFQTPKQIPKYSPKQRYKEQRNVRRAFPHLQLPSSLRVLELPPP